MNILPLNERGMSLAISASFGAAKLKLEIILIHLHVDDSPRADILKSQSFINDPSMWVIIKEA